MKTFLFLLFGGFATQGSSALTWVPAGLRGGIVTCPTDNVNFHYYVRWSRSETMVSMKWIYHGNNVTKTILNLVGYNRFVPTHEYTNKVLILKKNMPIYHFYLRNATVQDTGRYEIETQNIYGSKQTYNRKGIPLVVVDYLRAKLSDKADWNVDSQSFSLSLTCGVFIHFLHSAPMDVEWITPDGSVKKSTKYSNGKFYLQLDNPVKGGQYVCKVPKELLSKACLRSKNINQVTVTVNEDKANILESINNKLKEDVKKCNPRSSSNCEDGNAFRSGKKTLHLKSSRSVEIYCDQDTDGGRWNVFQRRQDGSVDFNRGWSDYRNGFGDPEKEFWLGLETIHQMTSDGQKYELRFDLEAQDGSKYYAVYDDFSIGPESEGYAIHFTDYSGGNAGNNFWYHKNMKFSTKDRDQDLSKDKNCAEDVGGWWFKMCAYVNLNGRYDDTRRFKGLLWEDITGFYESLKKTEMKFRVKK